MSIVTVRGVTLGDGSCRVIVPLVTGDPLEVPRLAAELAACKPDLIEWRADHIAELRYDPQMLLLCLQRIRRRIGEIPLLVTWRSAKEGGALDLPPEEYEAFCRTVCESGCADLLDVELFTAAASRSYIFACAAQHGVKTVCSSHDFAKTPSREEMVSRLCSMQQLGADIVKLAVMPNNRQDVAALLAATAEMAERHPETPVLTMSMGALGQVSRMAGGGFGSGAAFAAAGRSSAPGQPAPEDLRAALQLLDPKQH